MAVDKLYNRWLATQAKRRREMLRLWAVDGLSLRQIALQFGISKSRVHQIVTSNGKPR